MFTNALSVPHQAGTFQVGESPTAVIPATRTPGISDSAPIPSNSHASHETRTTPPADGRIGLLAALPRLSQRMTLLILNGDNEGTYSSETNQRGGADTAASNRAWAVVSALSVHAGAMGWERDQLARILLDTTAEAGRHARDIAHLRGRDRAIEWLYRAWDSAQEYRTTSAHRIASRPDAHAHLAELRTLIEVLPWRGQAATTDLRNLAVRLAECERAGGPAHDLSLMQLAERMGCTRKTAKASNRRLMSLGWLRMVKEHDEDSPTVWELREGRRIHDYPSPQTRQRGGVNRGGVNLNNRRSRPLTTADRQTGADLSTREVSRLTAEDAFAARGLGGSTLKVACALAERSDLSARDLMAAASVSQPTVSRATRRLAELGLAVRTGETWALAPNALDGIGTHDGDDAADEPARGWDDVAERVGTAGTAARRRAEHARLREQWAEHRRRVAENRRAAREPQPDPRRVSPALIDDHGRAIDPRTGEIIPGLIRADDGQWLVTDDDQDHDHATEYAHTARSREETTA